MIVIENHVHFKAPGIATGFRVVLPDACCTQAERIPFVLCLHDYGQNGERMLEQISGSSLVDQHNVALLLPDGQNSCFLNMAHGPQWESYVMEYLLPYVQRTFPLQSSTALLGLGYGGWAAARLYARYPQHFRAAVALDADPELPKRYALGKLADQADLEAAFGHPDTMAVDPLHPDTVWLKGVSAQQALNTLLEIDWSTPA